VACKARTGRHRRAAPLVCGTDRHRARPPSATASVRRRRRRDRAHSAC